MTAVEPTEAPIPAVVLGGAGYVAGELLRLLASHPTLSIAAVLSASHAGEAVATVFPHLAGALPELRFRARAASSADDPAGDPAFSELFRELAASGADRVALFSAAPHGASAAQVDALLAAADGAGIAAHVVDLSADFRYPAAQHYEAVYRSAHGAPQRLAEFVCAVPEHCRTEPGQPPPWSGRHAGHPGCFTTAVTLAAVPLLACGWIEPELFVSAVTGSTGSGRSPSATTHHPERQSNLWAYQPLQHRHAPEMTRLVAAATGSEPRIAFVPHSGPFARGIHATVHARLTAPRTAEELTAAVASYYAGCPFIEVLGQPPRLKDVVGSNRCRLAVAAGEGGTVALFSVIDNLVKGAAGGGVQWMNRLLGLPETAGLELPSLGWT
jgi:N-acetyl-gamma-glutamyl-phosphate reductase